MFVYAYARAFLSIHGKDWCWSRSNAKADWCWRRWWRICLWCKRPGFDPWVGKTPLEEGMATHYCILAWRIPWMEDPVWLESMGSQIVGQDWVTNATHMPMCFYISSFTQSCPALCYPMDCSTSGFPVHHQLPELTQTHVHPVDEAIQTSHPLLSPSPPAFSLSQHQSLFQWVSSSHQMARVLQFWASASVLPISIQNWFPLGLTGWISL